MPDSTIACPFCSHEVRLPDVLLGQPVRCPRCYAMFRAPSRNANGELGAAEALPEFESVEPSTMVNGDRLRMPARLLLFVGILGVLFTAQGVIANYTQPEQFRENIRKNLEWAAKMMDDPNAKERLDENVRIVALGAQVCLGLGVLTIIGAFCAITRQSHLMATIGSIAASVNLFAGCCLLGLPVGIWMIVVLYDPNVRRTFGS